MICSFNVIFWTSIDYIRLIIIDHLKIYELVKITIIFIFIEILTRYFLIFSSKKDMEDGKQEKQA